MDYVAVGRRIRAQRKKLSLSQEELAEMVNISTVHMSHIETGYTKLSLPVLVDLACALGVRTDDLMNSGIVQKINSLHCGRFCQVQKMLFKNIWSIEPHLCISLFSGSPPR